MTVIFNTLLYQIRANSRVPGAIAIFPFSSKMAFPSKVTAGSILCSNMITLDLSRLKKPWSTKNSSVGPSVNSLVMIYLGRNKCRARKKKKKKKLQMGQRRKETLEY